MKRTVIFIPFHNPWNWHTDYANQTATILSGHHTVLCFLWGDAVSIAEIIRDNRPFRPVSREGNLWKIQPLFLIPGKRLFTAQLFNLAINLLFAYGMFAALSFVTKRDKLLWFFGFYDPVLLLIPPFFRHITTVYDCVDVATHPTDRMRKRIEQAHERLLKRAWVVVTNSRTLRTMIRPIRPDVTLVPLGFREEMFISPLPPSPVKKNRRPLIGYSGSIDYRLDVMLLTSLIRSHPNWDFGLFGPMFQDHLSPKDMRALTRLLTLPNVTHLYLDHRTLASALLACDVLIIPYDTKIPLAKYAFPMKIMEYWFAEKPVVSTSISELTRYARVIRFADDVSHFSRAISDALKHPPTRRETRTAKKIAADHTWKRKIDAIRTIMRHA